MMAMVLFKLAGLSCKLCTATEFKSTNICVHILGVSCYFGLQGYNSVERMLLGLMYLNVGGRGRFI